MEALLQYMYLGYSIVKCDRLPSLCKTAKALGIKEFPTLEIAKPKTEVERNVAVITQINPNSERNRTKVSRTSNNDVASDYLWPKHKKLKTSPEKVLDASISPNRAIPSPSQDVSYRKDISSPSLSPHKHTTPKYNRMSETILRRSSLNVPPTKLNGISDHSPSYRSIVSIFTRY